jgi:hypothetical protein
MSRHTLPERFTIGHTRYIQYVPHCPRCLQAGYLTAHFSKKSTGTRWSGPYFDIIHHRFKYDAVKYALARADGIRGNRLTVKSRTWHQTGRCYFGRTSPVELTPDGLSRLSKPIVKENQQQ